MNCLLIDLLNDIQGTFNKRKLSAMLQSYIGHMDLRKDPRKVIDFSKGVYPTKVITTLHREDRGTNYDKARFVANTLQTLLSGTFARSVTIKFTDGFYVLTFNTNITRRLSLSELKINGRESAILTGA